MASIVREPQLLDSQLGFSVMMMNVERTTLAARAGELGTRVC
jgi:hypothetical protein